MIPGEFLTTEPQFEPEIGGGDNDADLKRADIVLISSRKTNASFLFEDQLMLLNALEVAIHGAQVSDTRFISVNSI